MTNDADDWTPTPPSAGEALDKHDCARIEKDCAWFRARVREMEKALREMTKAPCMGELLGEDCGWCPACRARRALDPKESR